MKSIGDAPMNWSFATYPSEQVAAIYAFTQNPCAGLEEAFEENLPF